MNESLPDEKYNADEFIKDTISKNYFNGNKNSQNFFEKSIKINTLNRNIERDIKGLFEYYLNNEDITLIFFQKIDENIRDINIKNKIKLLMTQATVRDCYTKITEYFNIFNKEYILIKNISNKNNIYTINKISVEKINKFDIFIAYKNYFLNPSNINNKIKICTCESITNFNFKNNNVNIKYNNVNIKYNLEWTDKYKYIKQIIELINIKIQINNKNNKIFQEIYSPIFIYILDTLYELNFDEKKCKLYAELMSNEDIWNNSLEEILNIINLIKENKYAIPIIKLIDIIKENKYKIPIIKEEEKTKNDILIISYNENNKYFEEIDTYPILFKILIEKPKIIFVCTQESSSRALITLITLLSKKKHYQHVLGVELMKLGYGLIGKIDASKSFVNDKNVRMRVYYRTDDVIFSNFNNQFQLDSQKYLILPKNISIQSCLSCGKPNPTINISRSKSKISGLGTSYKYTLYKGSVMAKIKIIIKNSEINKEYKIIVVNSHLFYKDTGNTGLQQRKEEMINLIKEFKLVEEWKNSYNIFFSGDLNFKLNVPSDSIENLISQYIQNESPYKKNFTDTYIKNTPSSPLPEQVFQVSDELADFLSYKKIEIECKNGANKIKARKLKANLPSGEMVNNEKSCNLKFQYEYNFYQKLLESILSTGLHLTYKYRKGQAETAQKLFYDKNISLINQVFDLTNNPIKKPSMSDRILYVMSEQNNISISPSNFDIFLFPDKSSHKMITLSFELV
jgi:hypothetical protein